MYKAIAVILMNLLYLCSKAQSQTEVAASEGGYGMIRTNIAIQYDHTWGRVSDGFAARVSYEFIKKQNITLSGNFRYTSTSAHFRPSDTNPTFIPADINLNGIHTMEQLGLTATARTIIFGKMLTGLGIINSEWGIGGFNRVSATIMGMIMLRATKDTQFGLGILGMINTTSKIPIFPVFIYRHRFNTKWSVNLYGGMFGIDFHPTPNNFLSIGADIDVKAFYFKPEKPELPRTCRYTQTNFRPMVKYRRSLMKNLYFDMQAGYAINMTTRINGVNGTREYIKLSQTPRPFVQASFSYSL